MEGFPARDVEDIEDAMEVEVENAAGLALIACSLAATALQWSSMVRNVRGNIGGGHSLFEVGYFLAVLILRGPFLSKLLLHYSIKEQYLVLLESPELFA